MKRGAVIEVDFALPREVKALFSVLRRAGIEVCAVGGCVRDLMRGAAPHDWDAAAAAPPERLRELLEASGYRVIPTGIKHGTLTVLCPRGDIMNERMPRDRVCAVTVTAATSMTVTDTSVAGATATDMTVVDTTVADTSVTDLSVSFTATADMTVSGATDTCITAADTTAADTTVADMADSDTATADMTATGATVTDTSAVDMTDNETTVTGIAATETTAADTSVIGATAADTSVIGATAVDTSVVGATVTDTSVADTAAADDRCAYTRVELTSYRRESGYSDRRHPDSVEYTDSLDEDLARRDFTINAMAYLDGVGVYDPYSGRADLESRTIRAVGEPERRFGEDALRILRGLRFAARFGFDIEPETLAAMRSCRGLLYDISVERLRDELLGLLRGAGAERLLRARYDILSIVLPELDETAYSAGAKLVGALNREYPTDTVSDAVRLAALLSALPAADAEDCARRLRFDKRAVRRIRDILLHIRCEYTDRVSIKRLLSEVGADVAVDVLRLAALGGTASPEALSWLEKIIENGECISLSRLKINGYILLRLGAKPRDCGRLLARIFDEVLCDRLENDPERLISYAERLINAEKSTCDN